LQVALKQRLQLDDQRELLTAAQLLLGKVGGHADGLSQWDGHGITPSDRTCGGSLKWTSSRATARSLTLAVPRPWRARTTSSTSASGADAPAVRPTRLAPVTSSEG